MHHAGIRHIGDKAVVPDPVFGKDPKAGGGHIRAERVKRRAVRFGKQDFHRIVGTVKHPCHGTAAIGGEAGKEFGCLIGFRTAVTQRHSILRCVFPDGEPQLIHRALRASGQVSANRQLPADHAVAVLVVAPSGIRRFALRIGGSPQDNLVFAVPVLTVIGDFNRHAGLLFDFIVQIDRGVSDILVRLRRPDDPDNRLPALDDRKDRSRFPRVRPGFGGGG